MEEGREDEEAGAVEQDTSQPEAVGALGEKRVVVIDREAGFSDSHQVRPLRDGEAVVGVDEGLNSCPRQEEEEKSNNNELSMP